MALDANGNLIFVGATAEVFAPSNTDPWNYGYTGHVTAIKEKEGWAHVEDQEGNTWCIDFDKMEVDAP